MMLEKMLIIVFLLLLLTTFKLYVKMFKTMKKKKLFIREELKLREKLIQKAKANNNFTYWLEKGYAGPYSSPLSNTDTNLPIYLYNRNWVEQKTQVSLCPDVKKQILSKTSKRVIMVLYLNNIMETKEGLVLILSDIYGTVKSDPISEIKVSRLLRYLEHLLIVDIEFNTYRNTVRCHSLELTPFKKDGIDKTLGMKLERHKEVIHLTYSKEG